MMKKELRGQAARGEAVGQRLDKGGRLRSKEFVYSSPNKENDLGSANLLSPCSPLSPIATNTLISFQSPLRTTPLETLQCLRSNKSKESLQVSAQGEGRMLFSGISRDGKFRVQSRSLMGQQLAKAVQYERKIALKCTLAAGKDKDKDKTKIPPLEPSRVSSKQNGVVKAYAINTHAGITRNYNEDRVSVTLNIKKNGIRSQFFAIYDGHGGNGCCQYLKDHLHQQLISRKDFPSDPKKALQDALATCQRDFCQMALGGKDGVDKSGSCALVALLVEDCCYIGNVGDSRAVLSVERGKLAFNLSRDHRPIDTKEQQRIFQRGGKIYRTEMTRISSKEDKQEPIIGPLRIFPGKLSVSRTIGDIQAKQERLGGLKGVVSAEAEVKKFRMTGKEDFIMLCCDGVFQRMESMEVIQVAWKALKGEGSTHDLAGRAVDAVLKQAMRRKSADNLTAIMICLSDLRPQAGLKSP